MLHIARKIRINRLPLVKQRLEWQSYSNSNNINEPGIVTVAESISSFDTRNTCVTWDPAKANGVLPC